MRLKILSLLVAALWAGPVGAQPSDIQPPARAEGLRPGSDPEIVVKPPAKVDPQAVKPAPRNIDPGLIEAPPADPDPVAAMS